MPQKRDCGSAEIAVPLHHQKFIINFKKDKTMTKIAKQLTELVGNTPLLELNKYSQAKGLEREGPHCTSND